MIIVRNVLQAFYRKRVQWAYVVGTRWMWRMQSILGREPGAAPDRSEMCDLALVDVAFIAVFH